MNNTNTNIELTQKSKRQIEFDLLKAIAIYLVIVGHVIQYITDDSFYNNDLWCIIYTFHMPLFLIISGYFFNINKITPPKVKLFIKSKFQQLIYPCITWAFILLFLLLGVNVITGKDFISVQSTINLFLFDLWYLKATFIIILLLTIYKLTKGYWRIFTSFVVFFLPVIDYWSISYSLPFFITGIIYKKVENYTKQHNYGILFTLLFLFLILFCFWEKTYLIYYTPYALNIKAIAVAIYRFIFSTIIALVIIQTTTLLIEKSNINTLPPIFNFGDKTLYIYVIQFIIIEKILCYIQIQTGNPYIDNLILVPILSILLLIIILNISELTLKFNLIRKLIWGK